MRGVKFAVPLSLCWLVACGGDDDAPSSAIDSGGGGSGGNAGDGGALEAGLDASGGSNEGGTIPPTPEEWVQEGHDAQRTGYTHATPAMPWTFRWFWSPPVEVHESTMARGVHPVTGGDFVYMPAGNQGLFALSKADGSVGWSITTTSFEGAAAYDGASLFIGGTDGLLYKLVAATGQVAGTFDAGSPIRHAVLLQGDSVFVATESGALFRVLRESLSPAWIAPYEAGSRATTPPAFSASRNLILFGTEDLVVHAVDADDGAVRWAVNPTAFDTTECTSYSYEYVWPVVADGSGVVFMRLRLGDQNHWLWGGGGPNGRYPETNDGIRALLESNPEVQALHALRLDDGAKAFTPAVGNGGVDAFWQTCEGEWVFRPTVGPMPAIRTLSDGKQVAYVIWRNGDVDDPSWDARWDSHLGEMVLDSDTVPGYAAGDLRFLQAESSQSRITDEACPVTAAGDTVFFAHWGASEAFRILDRSNALGAANQSPIATERLPSVIRRIAGQGEPDSATHWVDGYSNFYQDGRGYGGGNWWVYWNRWDPPVDGHDSSGYQDNHFPNRPRYTIVSDGMVIVTGNGGDLFVLSHEGG